MQSCLRLWGAVVLAIALGVGGCGGIPTAMTSTSARPHTARLAPVYRTGQYCLPANETKYIAAGFDCKKHHLARR
jgi:hypothetical protein